MGVPMLPSPIKPTGVLEAIDLQDAEKHSICLRNTHARNTSKSSNLHKTLHLYGKYCEENAFTVNNKHTN